MQYFDVGYARRLNWNHRPQAAALITAITDPHRELGLGLSCGLGAHVRSKAAYVVVGVDTDGVKHVLCLGRGMQPGPLAAQCWRRS